MSKRFAGDVAMSPCCHLVTIGDSLHFMTETNNLCYCRTRSQGGIGGDALVPDAGEGVQGYVCFCE